jgi:small subunit ribosomal protein S3e
VIYLCGNQHKGCIICIVYFQFVQEGVFKAELNEFFTRELAEDGYSGVEIRVTPTRTEIIILATRTQNVLGEKGRRIRELTSVVQKRFNFPEGTVELYAEKVGTRGLSAIAQAESLRYKLIGGLAVRRSVYPLAYNSVYVLPYNGNEVHIKPFQLITE